MFEKETPMNFPLFLVSIACAAIAISMIGCHSRAYWRGTYFPGALSGATRPMSHYAANTKVSPEASQADINLALDGGGIRGLDQV